MDTSGQPIGGGSWSHWAWHTIEFSTSDGSDPRDNGRTYSLVRNEPVLARTASISVGATAPTEFEVDTNVGSRPYLIEMSNPTSDTPLVFLLRHKKGPALWSITDLAKAIAAGGTNPEDIAMKVHGLVVDWRYHYKPSLSLRLDIPRNPQDLIRATGYGWCGESAGALVSLLRSSGIKARMRGLGRHIVAEAFFDEAWHMFDPDGNAVIRNHNREIVSINDLIDDPDLVLTGTLHRRDGALSSLSADELVELFSEAEYVTTDDDGTSLIPPEAIATDWMAPIVHPGDRVQLFFTDPWSITCSQYCGMPFPPIVGNGRIIREVDTELDGPRKFTVISKYPIVGGDLDLAISPTDGEIVVQIEIPGLGTVEPKVFDRQNRLYVDLTRFLRIPPRSLRQYTLNIRQADSSQKVRIKGRLMTDFQFAPRAHTHVNPGENVLQAMTVPVSGSSSAKNELSGVLKLSWIEPDAIAELVPRP